MKEVIITNKKKYLEENYPFDDVPELKDKKFCIHCERTIIVGDYKGYRESGDDLIYCPNAPECEGTIIDWFDVDQ